MSSETKDIEKPYPGHIYDPARIEIAKIYIEHELRKMLPNMHNAKTWQEIDQNIKNWLGKGSMLSIRDFWNTFHGIAMGYKLKNGLVQTLTAENITWTKEKFSTKDLYFGIVFEDQENIWPLPPSTQDVADHFNKSENLQKKQEKLELLRKFSQDSFSRDTHPIIVHQKVRNGKTIYATYDGNRRLFDTILQGRTTILAFVGRYQGEERTPLNFWLPTSFLMDLVENCQLANDYQGALTILKKLIPLSKSGEYELKERILVGSNEFKIRLKKDLSLG